MEAFDHALSTNGVVAGKDGAAVFDSSNDGLDDPASEPEWSRILPFFKEGVGDKVAKSEGLHGFVLLESVEVDLLFHKGGEGLDVGAEPAEPHDDVVLHLEDTLEIVGKSEHLLTETTIGSDSDAVFAHHADQGASVVLKN